MSDTSNRVFVANLGDVGWLEHGGLFVFHKEGDPNDADMEKVEGPLDAQGNEVEDVDDPKAQWLIHRAGLDRLKVVKEGGNVYLVTQRYEPGWPHPLRDYDEWFHKDLRAVVSYVGGDVQKLRDMFCSEDPKLRAEAYRSVADYFGWENFDGYPLRLDRAEVEERYGGLRK